MESRVYFSRAFRAFVVGTGETFTLNTTLLDAFETVKYYEHATVQMKLATV